MAAHETGIPLDNIRKCFQLLSEIGFCEYDEADESVFVPNMARFQIADRLKSKDNQITWIWRELQKLRSNPFFDRFLDIYGERYQIADYFPAEGPAKALGSIETESGDLETEPEMETTERAREGGGVERGDQVVKRALNLKVIERECSTPRGMDASEAQRILLNRREMSKLAQQRRRGDRC
jgi:hypothetical protein